MAARRTTEAVYNASFQSSTPSQQPNVPNYFVNAALTKPSLIRSSGRVIMDVFCELDRWNSMKRHDK